MSNSVPEGRVFLTIWELLEYMLGSGAFTEDHQIIEDLRGMNPENWIEIEVKPDGNFTVETVRNFDVRPFRYLKDELAKRTGVEK